MKNNIIVLCKPTHECNMNCEYCYDKKEKEMVKNKKMPLDILEKSIQIVLKDFENITWIWHGGEATIMGKEFYENALKIFDKYKTEKHKIEFLMQSNGKNIKETKKWLKELNIKPGYSYDITNQNMHRDKIDLIKYLNEEDGIISVVTEDNLDLVKYFKEHKKRNFISFNKLFFNNKNEKYDIKKYVDAYKKLFDFILYEKECSIEKNILNMINSILNVKDVSCNFNQCLGEFININPDGFIFTCDRFGMKDMKYCLGNVNNYEHILECFSSEGFYNILKEDFEFRKNNCEKCEINMFCRNICKANRVNEMNEIDVKENCFEECEFRREMINYIFDILFNLSKEDLLKINLNVYQILFENKFIFKFILDDLKEEKIIDF